MDAFMKLSLAAKTVLVCAVLLLIVSFLDWQSVDLGPYGSVGANEWHGVGVLAVLLVLALIAWEVVRLLGMKIAMGSLSDELVSAGLALLVALFTVIYFLTHGTARAWPAWLGLLLAIAIAVAAFMRAKEEGVEMPERASSPSGASTGSAGGESSSSGGDTGSSGGDTGSSEGDTEPHDA
jgi:uncharacterized membrane protein YgcG